MKTLSFGKSVENNLISQNEAKELSAAVANKNNIVISGNYNNGQARLLLEVIEEANRNDASTQLLLVEVFFASAFSPILQIIFPQCCMRKFPNVAQPFHNQKWYKMVVADISNLIN